MLVSVTLLRSGLQYLQSMQGIWLRRSLEKRLQVQLITGLHKLPIRLLQKERSGGLMMVMGSHCFQVGRLTQTASQAITNLMVLLGCTGLAFLLSWKLALAAVAIMGPMILVLRPLLGARLRAAGHQTAVLSRELFALIQETISSMRIIRLFNRVDWSLSRVKGAIDSMHESGIRSDRLATLSRPMFTLLITLALALLMVAGSFLLGAQPRTLLPSLVIFLAIAFRLMPPANGLTTFQVQLEQTGPILAEIDSFLRLSTEAALPDGDIPQTGLKREIALAGVSFRYANRDAEVLREVSLTIPVGKMTAVVGMSGAGKSSLVNLLTRLYDPSGGSVQVDGVDLRCLRLDTWQQRLAVVSQDIFLFHASVRDNFRFARPTASESEMISACQAAQIHEFLMSLPAGYDTVLEERGMRLSGGQRQRLVLARALLVEGAELLILDEATSELDAPTEEAVHRALRERFAGRTMLVIAHRLAVVRNADQIVTLENGRVAEIGTHDQLLAQRGVYAKLARAQGLEKSDRGAETCG